MNKKLPNSYCKSCHTFSMKFSNETCSARLDDGSRCKAVLFGILANDLIECTACSGSGKNSLVNCLACEGFGYEFVG